jgi:4-amino-4-deoxy-L-arabinose transferase-like glycosyltransferase
MRSIVAESASGSFTPTASRDVWQYALPQTWVVALAVIVVLAIGFRTLALDAYGLSEDEVNKVRAIEAYRQGVFSANAEHPMLMKLTMWASVEVASLWNRIAPAADMVSLESALRLPNAIAGAATAAALAGVGLVFFGPAVGFTAGLLWALDPNATAINRLGKEDSFLLLFFLLAIWAYEHAKRVGATEPSRATPWYTASGALFGLMLASKYMPHFLGVYALFNVLADRRPGDNKPHKPKYYGAMAGAFLAANFALLLPDTWRALLHYVQGGTLIHHGYMYAQQLYVNDVPVSPLGVPVTYYLQFLTTKVPLVVLACAGLGFVELSRHRGERGALWLRLSLALLVVPYSLMAAKFLRYSLPMLALVDLLAALGVVALLDRLQQSRWSPTARGLMGAAALTLVFASLFPVQLAIAPFFSLQQNSVGRLLGTPATAFPEETYDYGVREAVAAIAREARPGAVIASDASAVVSYYLAASGRTDLVSQSLSAEGLPAGPVERWVLVQDAHIYFENQAIVEQLRASVTPWRELRMRDALAVQIFHFDGD